MHSSTSAQRKPADVAAEPSAWRLGREQAVVPATVRRSPDAGACPSTQGAQPSVSNGHSGKQPVPPSAGHLLHRRCAGCSGARSTNRYSGIWSVSPPLFGPHERVQAHLGRRSLRVRLPVWHTHTVRERERDRERDRERQRQSVCAYEYEAASARVTFAVISPSCACTPDFTSSSTTRSSPDPYSITHTHTHRERERERERETESETERAAHPAALSTPREMTAT